MSKVAKTTLEPSIDELSDVLTNYGHPEIRVPAHAFSHDKTPYVAYVTLIFFGSELGDLESMSPVDWRKKVIDTLDYILKHLKCIGWVRVSGVRLTLDSKFRYPICTMDHKLVKMGEEFGIQATAEFELVPIKGELIEQD